MELRQLRYFVAVAETGNISQAAKRIYLTQPALSRQIKALEDELGQRLLERRAHSIHLTQVGQAFLEDARKLLQHADEIVEKVRASSREVRLRVGYAPSLVSGMLSVAVENFKQTHPRAKVELYDLSTAEMLAGLADGTLDVALTVAREDAKGGVSWSPLVKAEWRLATSRRHPLAAKKRIAATDLAGEPLLMFCRRDYPEYWDAVAEWLHGQGLPLEVAGEYDGTESLVSAVDSGLGVAMVTTRTDHLFPSRAIFKPLASPPRPVCIAAGYRAGRGEEKPLAVFIEEMRNAAKTVGVATRRQ